MDETAKLHSLEKEIDNMLETLSNSLIKQAERVLEQWCINCADLYINDITMREMRNAASRWKTQTENANENDRLKYIEMLERQPALRNNIMFAKSKFPQLLNAIIDEEKSIISKQLKLSEMIADIKNKNNI